MTDSATSHAREIVAVAQALDAAGLVPNKSGNVSVRLGDTLIVTPAGVPYRDLTPDLLVTVPIDSAIPAARGRVATVGRPSSEWRLHAAIYRARPDASAIVHTHSPHATALACARRGIPSFHYMIALAGGDIRCSPYVRFGTAELAQHAVDALAGRRAALLANHGVVAIGNTLARAHSVALEVENLARQYLALLAAGLDPVALDEEQLAEVMAAFTDYGRLDAG